eukprot:4424317-Pyramimonas_sp.AAC.1
MESCSVVSSNDGNKAAAVMYGADWGVTAAEIAMLGRRGRKKGTLLCNREQASTSTVKTIVAMYNAYLCQMVLALHTGSSYCSVNTIFITDISKFGKIE